jgi:hypothetical protein
MVTVATLDPFREGLGTICLSLRGFQSAITLKYYHDLSSVLDVVLLRLI